MKKLIQKTFVIAVITLISQTTMATDVTSTFNNGDLLTATQMTEIKDAVNSKQNIVTGTCAAGSAISAINTDGTVTCEVDDDTTYTAGTGITITGTTISHATATGSASVSGVSFTSAFTTPAANWAHYDIQGYVFPTTENGSYGTAPVQLPDGASINNVHCYFRDADATYDISSYYWNLYGTAMATGSVTTVATGSGTATTATPGMIDVANTTITHTVDNATNAYHIRIWMDVSAGYTAVNSSSIGMYGCTINYTL